jgi:hypothetical protein
MSWLVLIAGVVLLLGGAIAEVVLAGAAYSPRPITGVGIMLTAIGAVQVLRYSRASRSESAAARVSAEERDERTVQIKRAAGNRAYLASAALVYAGLMWVSLASNGLVPAMGDEVLWWFLAAAVVVPGAIYVVSMVRDERTH